MKDCINLLKTHYFAKTINSGLELSQPYFEVDGRLMVDKNSSLLELSSALTLPAGMGMNYDSLDECLQPDFWPELTSFELIIKSASVFIGECEPEVIDTLFSLFSDAAEAWTKDRHNYKNNFIFPVSLLNVHVVKS